MSTAQDFLRGAGSQISLHSPLGKWAQLASQKFDLGGFTGVSLVDVLLSAQISLHTPFARWALRISRFIDAGGLIDRSVLEYHLASGSAQQILSPFGKWQRFLSGAGD